MTPQDRAQILTTVRDAVKEATKESLPGIVDERLPLALGEALGPMIHGAIAQHVKWWVRGAAVGYLILAIGLGYAIHDNRVRATQGRGVVCQIITGGDASLYAYHSEGTITREQLRRALTQSAEYRKLLGPAPACSSGLTPPPTRLPPVPRR